MNKLTKIILSNKTYYQVEELFKYKSTYFSQCGNKLRTIVQWKKIPEDSYIYAYPKADKWIESHINYARAKLLLSDDFTKNNIFSDKKTTVKTVKPKNDQVNGTVKNNPVVEPVNDSDKKFEALPPIINLKAHEKFKDEEGKPLEIEVRGNRKYDEVYFKGTDVEIEFGMPRLVEHIIGKDTLYEEGIHYKFYSSQNKVTQKPSKTDSLYLTYLGLVRVLMVSRKNRIAEVFQKWAIKILFTFQMGTKEQKTKLFDKTMGHDAATLRESLKCNTMKISCIYLLTLNTVANLRTSLSIPSKYLDDMIVVKYGRTDDLHRRLNEHMTQTFESVEGLDLKVKYYGYVDDEYASKAESHIERFFDFGNYRFINEKYVELAIIPANKFDEIKKQYEVIQSKYSGTQNEYIHQIQLLEKDLEIKDRDIQLLKQQNENLNLKLQLAQMKKN